MEIVPVGLISSRDFLPCDLGIGLPTCDLGLELPVIIMLVPFQSFSEKIYPSGPEMLRLNTFKYRAPQRYCVFSSR